MTGWRYIEERNELISPDGKQRRRVTRELSKSAVVSPPATLSAAIRAELLEIKARVNARPRGRAELMKLVELRQLEAIRNRVARRVVGR